MKKSTKNTTSSEHIEHDKNSSQREKLMEEVLTALNKGSTGEHDKYFTLDDLENPSDITGWISTGSTLLDLAISNRPYGGLPIGRITEINGLEGTGKSLVAAHLMANTQKAGGYACMLDTENAASPQFWRAVGLKTDEAFLYKQVETVEEIFEQMERIIGEFRKRETDKPLTIVVDSVAAASTKAELSGDFNKDGYATGKSILISKAMRKITTMIGRQKVLILFTNQLRQNLKAAQFGDQWTVSGGKALAYHASVRIRVKTTGQLKKGGDNTVGVKCHASVVKNRMGPPRRTAEFNILFDSGIADLVSWIDVLKENDIIKGTSSFKYTKNSGEEISFMSRDFPKLLQENPELKKELYDKMAECCIMKYRAPNSEIDDDLTVDSGDEGGGEPAAAAGGEND